MHYWLLKPLHDDPWDFLSVCNNRTVAVLKGILCHGYQRPLHFYFSFGRPFGWQNALGQILIFGKSALLIRLTVTTDWQGFVSDPSECPYTHHLTYAYKELCVHISGLSYFLTVPFSDSFTIFLVHYMKLYVNPTTPWLKHWQHS